MCLQEVEEYVSKIKAAGGHATVHVYPGEGHAFMNSDPDSFKRMDSESCHSVLLLVAHAVPDSNVACPACQHSAAAYPSCHHGKIACAC